MFNYWSAPPSLLRAWTRPEETSPAADGRFRFGLPARTANRDAARAAQARMSRIRGYLWALLYSRATDPQLPTC